MLIDVDLIEFTPTDADPEQLQQLTESIAEKGLSHPIIVRPANELGKHPLVSGEKRLRAFITLGRAQIPADIREISENEGKEIRLHENLKRFNLAWWDQVMLVEELHNLRQTQHGLPERTGRPPAEGPKPKVGWSIRDTAQELQVGIGPLSEDLNLARALRHDPSLKNVKDKKTAVRLIRVATQRFNAEQEASSPIALDANQVFFGDAQTILKNFPTGSIDHGITDPPWIKFFDQSLTIDERTLPVFRELYRVLKHGAFLYVFCGLDDYTYYAGTDDPPTEGRGEPVHRAGELEKIGFKISKTPLLWRKINSLSRRGVSSWEYDRDFEFIILAVKGSPALTTGRKLSSIKEFPITHPSKMIHPHEKPIDLIIDLITDCSYEGNIIVDPFGGSGVIGEACQKTKRKFILCEREKSFYDGICGRVYK